MRISTFEPPGDAPLMGGLRRLAGTPAARIAAAIAALAYFAYYLTRFHPALIWPPAPHGDAAIFFAESRRVFAQGAYTAGSVYPYPPSAVLMFVGLSAAGAAAFMLAWQALMAAGLAVSVRAALAGDRLARLWPLLGLAGVIAADWAIGWDLRNANSNLVSLGLVTAGYALMSRRPMAAGALVALSVSLKLYAGLILLWMLVTGARRAFAAGAVTFAVLWGALPLALFGWAGTLRLYAGWRAQIAHVSAPATEAGLKAAGSANPDISLHQSVLNITGWRFDAPQVSWVVGAVLAAWLVVLAIYGVAWLRSRRETAPSRGALSDWIVLLLAPLPFSPWLEPYHAVPMLTAGVLLAAVGLDEAVERRARLVAGGALGILLGFEVAPIPFEVRGFALVAQFAVIVAALAWLRPATAKPLAVAASAP
ncbi:MAG TPA: glycosyltransferase 87 family protein [Caulobacteraceae bacterium]